jgi:hypothetical protein
MSIPLDRLYHFIEDIAQRIFEDRVIIYRFYPHGSKNINDMKQLNDETWEDMQLYPSLYCNDQEILDYDYYKTVKRPITTTSGPVLNFLMPGNGNIHEKFLLLHSEKRSANVQKYQQNQFIPVYWWSHAVIALDWFRFAQHVTLNRRSKKTFLIYNRAWAGTREYRLRFTETLIQLNLQNSCQSSVNPIEPELGIHYDLHHFKNPSWRPQTVLENYFPTSTAQSHYSADFDINDYENTDIEVVLETLFDDTRLHLTEKSLRPIALGQPFILAGTAGSLEYLRSYGFKTFSDIWDESYDTIENPEERLYAITDLMTEIANWGPIKEKKLNQAKAITEYNRKHFFSHEFLTQVVEELTINLEIALAGVKHSKNYKKWVNNWSNGDRLSRQTEYNRPNLIAFNNIKSLINSKLNPD